MHRDNKSNQKEQKDTAILFMSLPLQLAEPYHVVPRKLLTFTFVYDVVWALPSCFRWTRLCVIGWTIPRGSTRIDCCPEAWNLSQYCFIFLHNTDANIHCMLFDDRKYMDTYLPIHLENCYLGKQKNSLYFLASACEHLWPSPSHLVNCAKCEQILSKYVTDWSVWKVFLKFIKFQSFKRKSIDGHPFRSRMVRYIVGKGDIIFPSKRADC